MSRIRYALLSLAIILVPFLQSAAPVSADPPVTSASALEVSPSIVDRTVIPGKRQEFSMRVTNITSFPLPITSFPKNFVPLEEVSGDEAKNIFDASEWFTITPSDFILQPKETKTVTVTISAPVGAEAGGHYAALYYKTLVPVTSSSPDKAYTSAQVGALAFLTVPGNIKQKLELGTLSTAGLHQTGPIAIQGNVINQGNVHILPSANLHIYDWLGHEAAIVPLTPSIVLPGTTKPFTVTWDKKWLFGKYTAKVVMTYGTDTKTITSPLLSFWVVPWAYALAAIIFSLLLGIFSWKTHRRWHKAWDALRGKKHA